VDLAVHDVVEFRAHTFHSRIRDRFPNVKQFPIVIIPPDEATSEQREATQPIYRFTSNDEKWSTFLGPRIIAANVRGAWPGYPEYRAFVSEVLGNYLELMTNSQVERYSLGFYNRIPVSTIAEVREILNVHLDIPDDTVFKEFIVQTSRTMEIGSVLTQILLVEAEGPNEPYLAINNIIRATNTKGTETGLEQLMVWVDQAHEVGKEMIWNALSDTAKSAWKSENA
jgi:uncharacterized protein (TIGR04255 family)